MSTARSQRNLHPVRQQSSPQPGHEPDGEIVEDALCTPPPKLLLTVEEVAAVLSLGRQKTYGLVMRGAIPSVLIGRSRRIPVRELEAFVEHLTA